MVRKSLLLIFGTGALLLPQTPLFSRLNSPQPLFLVERDGSSEFRDRVQCDVWGVRVSMCVSSRVARRGTRL